MTGANETQTVPVLRLPTIRPILKCAAKPAESNSIGSTTDGAMTRTLRSGLAALGAAAVLLGVVPTAGAGPAGGLPARASGPNPWCSQVVLTQPARGPAAVTELGASLAAVARRHDLTGPQLAERLRSDPTLWVDTCGGLLYVDPPAGASGDLAADVAEAPIDTSQAFLLHSRPESTHVLHLDFDGQLITGTAWNTRYNAGQPWTAPPMSLDSDQSTFSVAERTLIIASWERVADDYAPFDVDVTTQDPGVEAITRSDVADTHFGTRVLITPDSIMRSQCGCGGIAYVGVFDLERSAQYQPAWALQFNSAKTVAEIVSHESGHNFGLHHDGTPDDAYYAGSGGWAPIMGVGYYQPVTQWSRGTYPSANNTEDDLAVIADGAGLATDDTSTSPASAVPLAGGTVDGLIGTTSDQDWYSFGATAHTTMDLRAAPLAAAPNLDLRLVVTAADGRELARSEPPFVAGTWPSSSATALLDFDPPTTGTYRVMVEGVGNGIVGSDGETDYGSLGRYRVTLQLDVPPPVVVTSPVARQRVLRQGEVSIPLVAAGGTGAPYAWTVTGGALPPGLALVDTQLVGRPTQVGTYSAVLEVTDSAQNAASATVAFDVADPLTLSDADPGVTYAMVGQPVEVPLDALGGFSPYEWSADGALPGGLLLAGAGIAGTPTTPGSPTMMGQVTDDAGNTVDWHRDLMIADPLVITSEPPAGPLTTGTTWLLPLRSTGGYSPSRWEVSGLPPGITLSDLPTEGGPTLRGTPTTPGTYRAGITVIDEKGFSTSSPMSITVTAPAAPDPPLPPAPPTSPTSTTPAVPTSTTPVSPTPISPTPVPAAAATNGTPAAQATPLRIVTPRKLPSATRKRPYSRTLLATGSGGTTWRLVRGWLPSGLRLDRAGRLQGTPRKKGTKRFTLRVTDAVGAQASRRFVLRVK